MTLCAWTLKSLMPTEGRQVQISLFPCVVVLMVDWNFCPPNLNWPAFGASGWSVRYLELQQVSVEMSCPAIVVLQHWRCVGTVQKSKKRHVCSSWCQWNSAFSPQCSTGAGDTSQFLRWCIAWGQTRPQWRRSISHLSLVILRQGWNDRCCFCLKVKGSEVDLDEPPFWPYLSCLTLWFGFLNSPRVILTISPTKSSLPLPPLKHPLHLRLYNEKDMDMCSLLQATSLGGLIRLKWWRLAAFRWSVFAAEFFNARSWAFALPH